jgi:two-component system, OmpR family, copper resistance phosphate regulon response regulator CusR
MDKFRILIVEDEPKVANFIKSGLEENNFICEIAFDGLIGKKLALTCKYDLIILDLNLPQINGYELCSFLRKVEIKTPILMLTALGSTDDIVSGFESGTDDYLVKPFEFRELLVRIRALLKRSSNNCIEPSTNILKISNLEMNLSSKIVIRDSKKIDLTAKEFNLLEFLMRNEGIVISRAVLAEKIWDITFDTGSNVIDVYINFLRKKLDRDFSPKLIHTMVGMGYVLKIDE